MQLLGRVTESLFNLTWHIVFDRTERQKMIHVANPYQLGTRLVWFGLSAVITLVAV